MARVSWLIPVRNGARWLSDAVGSALADSSADDEVVVIDDGSTDDPGSVLPADPRVRLLHQPPLGIVAALECGRGAAKGTYLARLDCDDLVIPGRLEAQLAVLANPEVAAVGGRARVDAVLGEVGEGIRRYVDRINAITGRVGFGELLIESPMFHPATTFSAAALDAVGGWTDDPGPEDYALFLRLHARGWQLHNLDRDVLVWRDRPCRLTRTDPRYAAPAIVDLKQRFLAQTRLAKPQRVVLWGAGRAGRPWTPWLLRGGHEVVGILDLDPRRSTRHGVPVFAPNRLPELHFDLLVVAVGSRGAREAIRGRISSMCPRLREGADWLAVC